MKKTIACSKAAPDGLCPSAAFPTLVFRWAAAPLPLGGGGIKRPRAASRDQVQRVGGLDPASQLLAPLANRSPYAVVMLTIAQPSPVIESVRQPDRGIDDGNP
jgi:hypothetical protein